MNKFLQVQGAIFEVFNTSAWKAENIYTSPENFRAINKEGIRVHFLMSAGLSASVDVRGILRAEIFVEAQTATNRALVIAGTLDKYFQRKSIKTPNGSVQFMQSTVMGIGVDPSNKNLYRFEYSLPFNFPVTE